MACGISQPGIKPGSTAVKVHVLTTELPGNSPIWISNSSFCTVSSSLLKENSVPSLVPQILQADLSHPAPLFLGGSLAATLTAGLSSTSILPDSMWWTSISAHLHPRKPTPSLGHMLGGEALCAFATAEKVPGVLSQEIQAAHPNSLPQVLTCWGAGTLKPRSHTAHPQSCQAPSQWTHLSAPTSTCNLSHSVLHAKKKKKCLDESFRICLSRSKIPWFSN